MVLLETVLGCVEAEVNLADLADNVCMDDVPLIATVLTGQSVLEDRDMEQEYVKAHRGW